MTWTPVDSCWINLKLSQWWPPWHHLAQKKIDFDLNHTTIKGCSWPRSAHFWSGYDQVLVICCGLELITLSAAVNKYLAVPAPYRNRLSWSKMFAEQWLHPIICSHCICSAIHTAHMRSYSIHTVSMVRGLNWFLLFSPWGWTREI